MLENNNFDEVVLKRHTAREFDPEITISKGELLQMITYATKAPSALNMQPTRFVVAQSNAAKEKIAAVAGNFIRVRCGTYWWRNRLGTI